MILRLQEQWQAMIQKSPHQNHSMTLSNDEWKIVSSTNSRTGIEMSENFLSAWNEDVVSVYSGQIFVNNLQLVNLLWRSCQ